MVLLSTAGVGLLILYLRQGGDFLVAVIGALSYTIGSVFYALVIYTQGADLIGYLEGNYPDYHGFGNWFWLTGLFLLGTAFLKAGFPTWLSYLTIGTAVVLAIVLLMSPGLFFIVPFLAIGLLLVVGIVVLRR